MSRTIETTEVCSRCDKTIERDPKSIGTGYARTDDGAKVCYLCCAEDDRKCMREHGKITLYLTCEPRSKAFRSNGQRFTPSTLNSEPGRSSKGEVTNWPGSLRFPCYTQTGNHNIAGTRYDCWFKFEGFVWHGVTYGDNTQICHCKRTKQTA